jgi:hypothetical protein
LRLSQTVDPVDRLSRGQIDDVDGAVAQLGHEQALAPEIDRHVIDAAGDIGEWDPPLQQEGWIRIRCPRVAERRAEQHE